MTSTETLTHGQTLTFNALDNIYPLYAPFNASSGTFSNLNEIIDWSSIAISQTGNTFDRFNTKTVITVTINSTTYKFHNQLQGGSIKNKWYIDNATTSIPADNFMEVRCLFFLILRKNLI